LKVIRQWADKDSDYIRKKVIEHNMSQLPEQVQTPKENVSFVLKNDDGEIQAGVTGTMYWHHLHIDFLWVDKKLRHSGYGSQLLNEIEQFAKDKGCRLICLDTFSFQAPDFYKKHGYKVFGTLEDHPKGFSQYFLEKRL
jgi:ribosomal protein S18 acetylase RimI-like enzyme